MAAAAIACAAAAMGRPWVAEVGGAAVGAPVWAMAGGGAAAATVARR